MGDTVTAPYADGMSPPAPPRPLRDLPPPPGITRVEGGVELCVYAGHADTVHVCLFDAGDREGASERRIPLTERAHGFWFGHLRGVTPGQRYAVRASGPWQPENGLRYNESKLLLDPYARAIEGAVRWDPAVYGDGADDSAPYVPRSVVHAGEFDWGDDRPPGTALADTIVYELHVKGFTKLHPDVPPELRGTYAGVGHPAAVEHLHKLGVTAVELLPVHQFVHDAALVQRGLRNYWGYQPIGYFAPHNEYATAQRGEQVSEFRQMVRALHSAGLEVILDVVFNHTAEGNENGPTLCFRGLDNAAYYRLDSDDPSRYVDDTGTGNTLDAHRPHGLRLIMDSLRYWVQEMHVDGFRFDLAASLGRTESGFDPFGGFLDAIGQDPVLSEVKLIAEPWDIGMGGYDLGAFPPGWSEWNGRYRDTVRDFWRGTPGTLADFATRLAGSADLYGRDRRPSASVNLVTVHDGFTLNDLVSYDSKHNEPNGEQNRDGTDDNRSWNCGAEGPTDDPAVLELRARQRRNLLATVLVSEGVPLLLGGDELARTQRGNNNAYCQDNEISWIDWAGANGDDLTDFVAGLSRIRREHAVLRRDRFFAPGELRWLRPDGAEMTDADWADPGARAVAAVGPQGAVLVNAWWEPLEFRMPDDARTWSVVLDTADAANGRSASDAIELEGRSLVMLLATG
jgi:isoamylase